MQVASKITQYSCCSCNEKTELKAGVSACFDYFYTQCFEPFYTGYKTENKFSLKLTLNCKNLRRSVSYRLTTLQFIDDLSLMSHWPVARWSVADHLPTNYRTVTERSQQGFKILAPNFEETIAAHTNSICDWNNTIGDIQETTATRLRSKLIAPSILCLLKRPAVTRFDWRFFEDLFHDLNNIQCNCDFSLQSTVLLVEKRLRHGRKICGAGS